MLRRGLVSSLLNGQGRLALRVAVPSYDASKKTRFDFAVGTVLQTALGELAYGEAFDFFEVEALAENPEDDGYLELAELPVYLRWRASSDGSSS